MYVCMYVCMYVLARTTSYCTIPVQYNIYTVYILAEMYVCGLYTDDVQLLHKIFLIYDQCTYSPLNKYLNFYY